MNDMKTVSAIRDGDTHVFDSVVTKYSKLLWHIVSGVLPSDAVGDIEECVADVFIYLWQNPEKYDSQRGSLKSWLCVIAKSRALNKLKELSRHCTAPLDDSVLTEYVDVEGLILDNIDKELLIAAVKCLQEPDREVFIRKYCREEKISDIAKDLGLSVKSVENRLYRTRIRLKEILNG